VRQSGRLSLHSDIKPAWWVGPGWVGGWATDTPKVKSPRRPDRIFQLINVSPSIVQKQTDHPPRIRSIPLAHGPIASPGPVR
jgi:hypothetical protein